MSGSPEKGQRKDRLSSAVMFTAGAVFLIAAIGQPKFAAMAAPYMMPPVSPIMQPPPPPMPVLPPSLPPLPPQGMTPPVVVPTDVTNPLIVNPTAVGSGAYAPYVNNIGTAWALNGIQAVGSFPKEDQLRGSSEWILVRSETGSAFTRPSPYSVDFKDGRILVSVKKPSNLALIKTPFGEIANAANGDVLLEHRGDTLRVLNIDGLGQSVKVKLDKGPFTNQKQQVAIAPGYEIVAANHKLTPADLHPRDGLARRHYKTLENGHMAVGEVSIESAMKNVSLIADMQQNLTGVKERRILGDMSKMASVLNYMNGTQGYKTGK